MDRKCLGNGSTALSMTLFLETTMHVQLIEKCTLNFVLFFTLHRSNKYQFGVLLMNMQIWCNILLPWKKVKSCHDNMKLISTTFKWTCGMVIWWIVYYVIEQIRKLILLYYIWSIEIITIQWYMSDQLEVYGIYWSQPCSTKTKYNQRQDSWSFMAHVSIVFI